MSYFLDSDSTSFLWLLIHLLVLNDAFVMATHDVPFLFEIANRYCISFHMELNFSASEIVTMQPPSKSAMLSTSSIS